MQLLETAPHKSDVGNSDRVSFVLSHDVRHATGPWISFKQGHDVRDSSLCDATLDWLT